MDINDLCQEYMNGNATSETVKTLADGIQKGVIDLLKLVEALGIYLTSSNVDNRCSGTQLLSEVLTQLNFLSHKLPIEDVEYLVAFHCDRLKDRAIILPHVLSGIHAMVSHYHLSDENVVLVCRTIFKEVHNQSLKFSDRSLVFLVMEHFLLHHIKAVQAIGSEFVLGYIQAIDGERDPRNLLTVFSSVPIIVQKLPFETLTEDLFEVTSCYFPIDFTPPPNDPNAVSREALILALRKSLTATPKFAEFCLPLLLEKLSSDILSAKLDSLLTLEAGAAVFGPNNIQPFIDSLWAAIRKEMFMSSSSELQVTCAKTLSSLVGALSTPLQVSSNKEDLLKSLIDKVLQDCQRYLSEPESKLIRPAVHTLCAVARGSDPACVYVVTTVMPVLIEQYTKASREAQRRIVLEAVFSFVAVVKDTSSEEGSCPLSGFKGQLLDLLQSTADQAQSSTITVAIATMKNLLEIQGLFDPSQVSLCCDYLKTMATNLPNDSVRTNSCGCLGVLARLHPVLTREHLLPPLFEDISDPSLINTTTPNTIKIITAVSTHSDILTLTLPTLVDYLASILASDTPHWQVATTLTTCLLTLVSENIDGDVCKRLLEGKDGALVRLVSLCVRTSTQSEEYSKVLKDLTELVRRYTLSAADDAVQWLYQFLVNVLVSGEQVNCSGGISLSKLDHRQPPEHTQLICLITALVSAARHQVTVCYSEGLSPVLLELTCHCTHQNTCQYAAKGYASIINKMEDGPSLAALLNEDTLFLWKQISEYDNATDQRLRALTSWIWLTKALVTRSHPKGKEMVLKLLELCGDECVVLKKEASEGFKLLLEDSEDVLNTHCHANVRLFYKQQLFVQVVPEIVQQFKIAKPGKQQYLLLSLSHCMQGVPKQVLLSELPKLLPLLLESLSSDEVGLKVSTLQGLLSLIEDTPLSVVEHVPTLLPRLLALTKDKASMVIRSVSLQCVGAMTALPTHVVYPYQGTILRGVAPCLDDHKRLVRQDAVNARSKWFFLGT